MKKQSNYFNAPLIMKEKLVLFSLTFALYIGSYRTWTKA